MKPTVSIEPTSPLPAMDRRQFLVSFIIATAGTLAGRVAATDEVTGASPAAADWQRVLQAMFPHPGLDPALYGVPAGALVAAAEKDAATRQLLDSGWQSLQQAAGGDWATASDDARTRAVAAIVGTPLFGLLRQTTVFTFYGNPRVWEAFGYEGDAWAFGGYSGRRLDTIDWLPDPPLPAGRK